MLGVKYKQWMVGQMSWWFWMPRMVMGSLRFAAIVGLVTTAFFYLIR